MHKRVGGVVMAQHTSTGANHLQSTSFSGSKDPLAAQDACIKKIFWDFLDFLDFLDFRLFLDFRMFLCFYRMMGC